jgi:hypothetical protein
MGNTNASSDHPSNKETHQLKTSNSTPSLNNILKNTSHDFHTLTKSNRNIDNKHNNNNSGSGDQKKMHTNLNSVHYQHIGGSVNSRLPWSNADHSPLLTLQQNKFDTINKYKNHRKLKATSYLLHGILISNL